MIVATWNLENLFTPESEFGPTSQEAYEAKLDSLAAVITEIGPDVLAVQEVGSSEALDDLVARLDGDWHVALSRFPDRREIRVGFVSRPAFDDVEDVRDFPPLLRPVQVDDEGATIAAANRGVLRVRVTSEGRPVDLATCHLKSKLLTYPGERFSPHDEGERARFGAYALYQRAAEAVTVRSLADRLLDGRGGERAVVVLGDLNDEPYAATTQILLGPPGSEIGTEGFERPDQGDPLAAVERRAPDPGGAAVHAGLPRPARARRPRARQPHAGAAGHPRGHHRAGAALDHRVPVGAPERPRLRSPPGGRGARPRRSAVPGRRVGDSGKPSSPWLGSSSGAHDRGPAVVDLAVRVLHVGLAHRVDVAVEVAAARRVGHGQRGQLEQAQRHVRDPLAAALPVLAGHERRRGQRDGAERVERQVRLEREQP